jgi:hypothetical protein
VPPRSRDDERPDREGATCERDPNRSSSFRIGSADGGLSQESHGKLPAMGYFLGLFLFVVVAGWLDTKIPWPRARGR